MCNPPRAKERNKSVKKQKASRRTYTKFTQFLLPLLRCDQDWFRVPVRKIGKSHIETDSRNRAHGSLVADNLKRQIISKRKNK